MSPSVDRSGARSCTQARKIGKAWNSPNKVGTPLKSTGSEGGTRVNRMFGKEMFGKGSRKCLKRVGSHPFQADSFEPSRP